MKILIPLVFLFSTMSFAQSSSAPSTGNMGTSGSAAGLGGPSDTTIHSNTNTNTNTKTRVNSRSVRPSTRERSITAPGPAGMHRTNTDYDNNDKLDTRTNPGSDVDSDVYP